MKNIKTALLSAVITCGLSLGSVNVVAEYAQPGPDAKNGVQNTRLHHVGDASKHKPEHKKINKEHLSKVTEPKGTRLHHVGDASNHKQESRKVAQNYIAKQDVSNNRLHHVGDASAHKQAIN